MVAHTRATGGPGRIRPLNRPRPLRMEADDDGRPVAIHLTNGRFTVEEVLETWRIDEEWWRKRTVSRLYFSLALADGRTVTVYRDLIRNRWQCQNY